MRYGDAEITVHRVDIVRAGFKGGQGLHKTVKNYYLRTVVKVVMCSRGGSASEVETHKNIDSVLHTKTTFQAHSIFSVSIQK